MVAVTEESRYQLFQRLDELLGPEKVSTMMELLPPVGWADVATKRDLDHLHSALDARMDTLDTKIDARFGSLGHEDRHAVRVAGHEDRHAVRVAGHEDRHGFGSLDAKVDRLGVELRAEFASGNQSLRSEMFREQRNQTLALIGANTTITALLLAAFQLL